MPYTILKTDGTKLVDIIDGQVNNTTDLTLIGRNATTFGQSLNEDLVYLLENFANSTAPNKPLTGQLWFNTETSSLQVYTGLTNGWRSTGAPIVKDVEPLSFITGDLWMDSLNKQLWFYDGTALTLAGPSWTKSQGKTGFVPDTIYDNFGNPKTILYLYVNETLMGIYSASDFTPYTAIPGFTSLKTGFNSNSLVNVTFDIKVTDSDNLGGILASNYVRNDVPAVMAGPLTVTSSITLGPLYNVNLKLSSQTFQIENTQANADISIRTKSTLNAVDNIYVKGSRGFIGINNNNPQAELDVTGSAQISGTLKVSGKTLVSPVVLTLIDNDILSTIQPSTITILQKIANESNYLNGQLAYVHYQHINFTTSAITRHSSTYIISNGVWTHQADL